jgi:hypothetical protein
LEQAEWFGLHPWEAVKKQEKIASNIHSTRTRKKKKEVTYTKLSIARIWIKFEQKFTITP